MLNYLKSVSFGASGQSSVDDGTLIGELLAPFFLVAVIVMSIRWFRLRRAGTPNGDAAPMKLSSGIIDVRSDDRQRHQRAVKRMLGRLAGPTMVTLGITALAIQDEPAEPAESLASSLYFCSPELVSGCSLLPPENHSSWLTHALVPAGG